VGRTLRLLIDFSGDLLKGPKCIFLGSPAMRVILILAYFSIG